MAAVSSDHDALLADLRILADTVLDRVEALVEQVAAQDGASHTDAPSNDGAAEAGAPAQTAGGCTWCPLCAVAALVRGENHELITKLASQLAALIAIIRELVARFLPPPRTEPDTGPDGPLPPEPPDRGGFVPISVTIRP
ncbi:hypothetical protein EV641_10973 [Rhodococcus sp. SMB37]|nr:hypothetical protein [Rhodococcus sp. SMB37]TCN51684.1 hypothetical protein EV641_10973 [Rhodococcus sp. SMB37]